MFRPVRFRLTPHLLQDPLPFIHTIFERWSTLMPGWIAFRPSLLKRLTKCDTESPDSRPIDGLLLYKFSPVIHPRFAWRVSHARLVHFVID